MVEFLKAGPQSSWTSETKTFSFIMISWENTHKCLWCWKGFEAGRRSDRKLGIDWIQHHQLNVDCIWVTLGEWWRQNSAVARMQSLNWHLTNHFIVTICLCFFSGYDPLWIPVTAVLNNIKKDSHSGCACNPWTEDWRGIVPQGF